jgi:hypothetical protein
MSIHYNNYLHFNYYQRLSDPFYQFGFCRIFIFIMYTQHRKEQCKFWQRDMYPLAVTQRA